MTQTQPVQSQLSLKPSEIDYEILKRLKAYLNLEGRRYFTADGEVKQK